jgi:hypothetical protein
MRPMPFNVYMTSNAQGRSSLPLQPAPAPGAASGDLPPGATRRRYAEALQRRITMSQITPNPNFVYYRHRSIIDM